MEEQKVWNCIKAPLLLHMEKELEDEVSYIATIKRLLRRTLVLSVLYSACYSYHPEIGQGHSDFFVNGEQTRRKH